MTPQERLEYLELVLGKMFWYTRVELIEEYHELKRKVTPHWTIEKTGDILGLSTPTMNRELRMARYLKKYPDLKKCHTRLDADKKIEGFTNGTPPS